ncbi:GIY-YIG nuclease family protein [Nakamurella sp. A5-74]|uniref:GIY-YIG nuclease family protein n=1 Tax=Nakamurella sp. A5-74 TaxID=3158264 RepID=A0AAU8DU35_9ACTN
MPCVYILQCSDGSLYVGSTTSMDLRLAQHNDGTGAVYTRSRRPVTLLWREDYENVADAFAMEKRIQNWSRAKRQALINGDFDELQRLSRSTAKRRRLRDSD